MQIFDGNLLVHQYLVSTDLSKADSIVQGCTGVAKARGGRERPPLATIISRIANFKSLLV